MLSSECKSVLRLAYVLVGEIPADGMFTTEDVEAVFRHLKRCSGCRDSFSPEERARIINGVLLERE